MGTSGGQIPPRPDESPPAPAAHRRWRRPDLLTVGVLVLIPVAIAFWSGFVEGFRESVRRAQEPRSFSEHGLSFDVPVGIHRLTEAERERVTLTEVPGVPSPTGGAWFEAFVLDGSNILLVFPDELPWIVDHSNLEAHAQLLRIGARDIVGVELDVATSTFAGYPSVKLGPNDVDTPDGLQATSSSVEAFDHNLGYAFVCQYTDGSGMRDKCQEILDSVSIEPVDPAKAGWTTLDSGGGHRIDVPPGWSDESPAEAELIHAVLFPPGDDIPIAEVQLFAEAIIGQPPPRRFVNDIVGRLSGAGFRLEDRATVDLPTGTAERLVFRMGNTRLVVFALVHGSQGITIRVTTFAGQVMMDLIAPTADATARSLTVED